MQFPEKNPIFIKDLPFKKLSKIDGIFEKRDLNFHLPKLNQNRIQ